MAQIMRMPEVAANTPEAHLLEWLVEEGTRVAAGHPVATVETAKATVDIEAETDGVVLRFVVLAGTDVQVGAAIAVVGEPGESLDGLDLGSPEPDPSSSAGDEQATTLVEPAIVAPAVVAASAPTGVPAPRRGRIFASPLARKLAKDASLELSDLVGTGPNGRIVRRDVTSALASRSSSADVPPAAVVEPPAVAPAAGAGYRDQPHSRLRRTIAARLTESKQSAPHFYVRGTARVDALLALREQLNDGATARVSVNDLIVMAVARAHQAQPDLNVIWTAEATRRFDSVDIAVAVATDDGLVTPVVRGVERMNVATLSASIRDFAGRARVGQLRPEELAGGSVTVTNLGMYDIEDFAAIINPPHASILAVGAAKDSVVVDDGTCAVARTMRFTLSVDHRPVDGTVAARWMQAFLTLIENPLRIIA